MQYFKYNLKLLKVHLTSHLTYTHTKKMHYDDNDLCKFLKTKSSFIVKQY